MTNYGFFDEQQRKRHRMPVNRNMDTPIANLNPHYTNSYYKEARTIWGSKQQGIFYNYSDRLWEWDYEKSETSSKAAREEVENVNTARYIQRYLSLYHDKPVELVHVMAGFNVSNGYPYRVYGYRFLESEADATDQEKEPTK